MRRLWPRHTKRPINITSAPTPKLVRLLSIYVRQAGNLAPTIEKLFKRIEGYSFTRITLKPSSLGDRGVETKFAEISIFNGSVPLHNGRTIVSTKRFNHPSLILMQRCPQMLHAFAIFFHFFYLFVLFLRNSETIAPINNRVPIAVHLYNLVFVLGSCSCPYIYCHRRLCR